jgi:hypothetical protein
VREEPKIWDVVPNVVDIPSGTWTHIEDQFPDAVARTLAAGALSPLEFLGAGMTSIVFCDAAGQGFKTARHLASEGMLADEAEWLATAGQIPGVQDHVARLTAYDPDLAVIERECVRGKRGTWAMGTKLRDLHVRIQTAMLPYGWTAPEYKEDSYVVARGRGPILVDASMPHRVGRRLVEYALDVLAGRRPTGPREFEDLAFSIRIEVSNGTIPEAVGDRVLRRIAAAAA